MIDLSNPSVDPFDMSHRVPNMVSFYLYTLKGSAIV